MFENARQNESAWPHRLAVLTALVTFPLLWVGGLVTTYQAGMAVPDWPNTYGYNLFLYPWQSWISGPWHLFIEHGHRLLGATVGMLSIALVAALIVFEPRAWVRALGVLVLLAVIAQGLLGGLRVIEDERQLAKVHGCFGPAVFALIVAVATVTSKLWRQARVVVQTSRAGTLHRLAALTTALIYIQIVLGAQIRHMSPAAAPSEFQAAVVFHLSVAALLALHVAWLWTRVRRLGPNLPALRRPATLLAALLAVEIGLGCSVWVANYGWPAWLAGYPFSAGHVTLAESPAQAHLTTAHVATGSLLLVTALALTLRSWRLVRQSPKQVESRALAWGGAA